MPLCECFRSNRYSKILALLISPESTGSLWAERAVPALAPWTPHGWCHYETSAELQECPSSSSSGAASIKAKPDVVSRDIHTMNCQNVCLVRRSPRLNALL